VLVGEPQGKAPMALIGG